MLRKIIGFLALVVYILSSTLVWSYSRWPIASPLDSPVGSFDRQHPIFATLGEDRERRRFHQGVDIGRGAGTPVYPVVSGVIPEGGIDNEEDGWVVVEGDDGRKYEYIHIRPNKRLFVGQRVIAGSTPDKSTLLGVIGKTRKPHLHFEEDDGALNPLRKGGLTPYVDRHVPEIRSGSIRFLPDGVDEPPFGPLTCPIVYGRVDIRADATDRRVGTNGTAINLDREVGVYRIGYGILDRNGRIVKPLERHEDYNVRFDSIPDPKNPDKNFDFVYYKYDGNYFTYWLTNNAWNLKEPNGYWNTRLRKGEEWNSPNNARVNSEAQYPDDRYVVRVIASDLDNEGIGDSKPEELNFIIDNFRPYVKRVTITQDGEQKYNAYWDWDATRGVLLLKRDTQESLRVGNATFRIEFSEPVRNPTASLAGENIPLTVVKNTDGRVWEGTLDIPGDGSLDGCSVYFGKT